MPFSLSHIARSITSAFALLLFSASLATAAQELQTLKDCVLVPTDWADGDSFQIKTADQKLMTVRLYGADCVECHVRDASDESRLREQRRYFGISKNSGKTAEAIAEAKAYGQQAADHVKAALAKPFTIHTAFADARGDSNYKRVYAFVITANGSDLAGDLVSLGLARAFGMYRSTFDGRSRDEYRAYLKDLELRAATKKQGIWAKTNWDSLPEERHIQRQEEEELQVAIGTSKVVAGAKIDPNRAPQDELTKLPGVGEVMAKRIIAGRPYKKIEDLQNVSGIGPATWKKLQPHLLIAN
jgi:endonuclease YncB( thermonuclease family)